MKMLSKFGVEFHQTKLKNGVDVFLFKRKGMPIYIRASFFAGSRFDNIPGTAHFLEHMLSAGTKKFPTKNLIANYIQKVGGEFGASTGNNALQFAVEIPEAQDLNVGIEVMSECLANSIFNDQTIENERGAIFSEINSRKSNPKEYIREVQRRISLQSTSAGRSTLGSEGEIKTISKNDLLNHQKSFVHSSRAYFVASGDVSIEELAEGLNSINLESGEKISIKKNLPIIKDKKIDIELYAGVDQLQVSLICRTSVENYKELCALKVLSNILGGGRGSRLVTKLRYENGLVYFVGTGVMDTIDWGTFSINLACHKNNFEKVEDVISKELKDLRENNITYEELEITKSRIAKGLIRYFQTSEAWVDFHDSTKLFSSEEFHTAEDYIQTVNSLNLEDIKKVIDKYLMEENFYTAICGDYK